MKAEFDPYQEWLSIPPNERPINYYRLLGLSLFESNVNVISNAADRQMSFVRTFQTGVYSEQSQQILNELAQARITLLDKRKKAEYDAKLRAEQKSGSNGGMGVVSSPSTTSLTSRSWSNNSRSSASSPASSLGNNSTIPNANATKPSVAFVKKHWVALLIALIAVQLIICVTGLLAYLLRSDKSEVAQDLATQQTSFENNGETSVLEAPRLAEQYYDQSVELQEQGNFDSALNKINVAVELQPQNERYKIQRMSILHSISQGKSETTTDPDSSEEQLEQSLSDTLHGIGSTPQNGSPQSERGKRPGGSSVTPEEAQSILQAETDLMVEAETQSNVKRRAEDLHNEAIQLQENGKYIQAAETLNEAIQLDPDNAQYKEEMSQFEELAEAEESYNESVDLEEKGLLAKALVKIEDALAIDPNNEDYIKEMLNIQTGYYKQYVQHRIKGEYRPALEKIEKAVKLVPKEEFYKEEKRKTEAIINDIKDWKELPEKDPDYGELVEDEPENESLKYYGFLPGEKAGDRKTVVIDGVEIAFRWCPPGTFMMGSPTSEANRQDDEKQHEVELTKGFWIMETQITVAMFNAFVNKTGYKSKGLTPWGLSNGKWKQDAGYTWLNPGFSQNDNNPVTCISWRDAVAFSKWLGGKIYARTKLPTEAQWEYACRAGSESAYFWGNDLNGDKANCNGNYPYGTKVKGRYLKKTVPVRSYQPNAWGVYDMHGNVWEWCLDGYSAYPNGKVTDPLERGDWTNRVFRGGSWSYYAERCRSSFRASLVPAIRLSNLGARCVVIPSIEMPEEPKDKGDFSDGKNAGDRVVKIVNGVSFAFRYCPPGSFMMGSPELEENRYDDEIQHQVTLTKGFWIMETEVTQKQWTAIMGDLPKSKSVGDNMPVNDVSWNNCQIFCKECARLGLPIQLPTEAQWEYACRAGTSGEYAGSLDEMAWYSSNSNWKIHPVGTKKPNAWGLYDMHGNVCEWCQDRKANYPSKSVSDPTGPSDGPVRVCRGGDYKNSSECRSAFRGSDVESSVYDQGFRCVISTDLESSKAEEDKNNEKDKELAALPPSSHNEKAGDRVVITINGVEFVFRWAPPGRFTMGGRAGKKDEMQHEVRLTKGFWIQETEVTQKQWEMIMWHNPSRFKGDDLPVEGVSWDDSQVFCAICTQLGLPVQLPTEAQWEYSCRARTTGTHAGDLDEMAWYSSNSEKKTHPVGTKKPNAWGLYDMHGNVYEWCQDWKAEYPSGSVTNPTGPSKGEFRVFRGGSYMDNRSTCRSADRSIASNVSNIGLRLISVVDLKSLKTKDITIVNDIAPDRSAGKRETRVIDGVEFAFRWCPAGTFMMGMPEYRGRYNETPHRVMISKGFWMLETEVTVGMYKAFVNDTEYESIGDTPHGYSYMRNSTSYRESETTRTWDNPGFVQDDKHPVTCVSWDDAVAFCKWLSEKTGHNAALPTESQWEYACRAGTTEALAGDLEQMAWRDRMATETHPVGTKNPNAWGLYDMYGNVSEWCHDWYGNYPIWRVIDPTGPSTGYVRIHRGGSCMNYTQTFGSADRDVSCPGYRDRDRGFRFVIDALP